MKANPCDAPEAYSDVELTSGHLSAIKLFDKSQPLTDQEVQVLESSESLIAKHLADFFQVGCCLMTIREQKLYREHFSSFEQYCRSKWGIGRSHAYRMLDAGKIHKILSPMGDMRLPENERQVRPLIGLKPDEAKSAWEKTIRTANGKKITGKMVSDAVNATTRPVPIKAPQGKSELWQQKVVPLLKMAVRAANMGDRESTIEMLSKAQLQVEIGRRAQDVDAA